jgi:phosphoglycolate phosphatase-like HAD superfamily hydrolase
VNLWLFDLDGVLIHPGGYREALRRTVAHFSQAAGYAQRRLAEPTIEAFEAQGVTCEWDIAGICLAADIFTLWRANPALPLPADLDACLETLHSADLARPEPDYANWARQVGALGGETPSASAVKLFRHEAGRAGGDLARVGEFEAVLDLILGHPREFTQSPVMRYFQQFTLGSRAYEAQYRFRPVLETPSLLSELDRPAISAAARDRILALKKEKRIHSAIITARPSRPQSAGEDTFDYPPEAEIAREVVGLEALPLAGAGQMQWLARRHGQTVDAYLKPNPVHALAAIGLALGGAETAALEAARTFVEDGKIGPPLDRLSLEKTDIFVFEDSPTGVVGTQSAVDLLARKHLAIRVGFLGISSGSEKRAALLSLGAEVFDSTDDALEMVWGKAGS